MHAGGPQPQPPTGPHSSEPHSLKYEVRNLTSDLNTISQTVSGLERERKEAREELGREREGEEIGRNQDRGE